MSAERGGNALIPQRSKHSDRARYVLMRAGVQSTYARRRGFVTVSTASFTESGTPERAKDAFARIGISEDE
jgi:hypothetical protein